MFWKMLGTTNDIIRKAVTLSPVTENSPSGFTFHFFYNWRLPEFPRAIGAIGTGQAFISLKL